MKDIAGELIEVGDRVAFNPPRYKGLIRGKVVAFTPKMVRIEYKWTTSKDPDTTVVFPTDCVVIKKHL